MGTIDETIYRSKFSENNYYVKIINLGNVVSLLDLV